MDTNRLQQLIDNVLDEAARQQTRAVKSQDPAARRVGRIINLQRECLLELRKGRVATIRR